MTTYATDSQGKFIPASQRPDGTWRKPRRVRDGYVPQEEVPLYESKGKQFSQKPTLPPGLSPEVVQKAKEKREREKLRQQREEQRKAQLAAESEKQNTSNAGGAKGNQATGGRTKKTPELPDIMLDERPVKSKQQVPSKASQHKSEGSNYTSTSGAAVEELSALAAAIQLNQQSPVSADGPTTDGLSQELMKKLRKLRKKIREIEVIEERLRSSDAPRPDKDQLEKVKRKQQILQEIEELETQSSAGAM
ncbi:partner of Y14 and mago [Anopheles ziemanni]|uniref:partner of Y14 and mago n=1 Tax=Anopheles coustani TaxID=139045 RepID=UPI00265B538D|nr:partner of Y14 and mago [Anopheles coustani]XP_058175761.1 partner of Y14 and mago [Anopheles ziemanni]